MSEATEDFLEVDVPIPGQSYVCLSFISPEKVLKDKNLKFLQSFLKDTASNYDLSLEDLTKKYTDFLYANQAQLEQEFHEEQDFKTSVRGIKVRGVYQNLKEAQFRASALQKRDPNFNVYVGQVGYWLPWDPEPDNVEDQEYAEPQLNNLVKKYKENQSAKDAHFRENIDYIKEQQAKKVEEVNAKKEKIALDNVKVTEELNVNVQSDHVEETTPTPQENNVDSSSFVSDDPWMQRKTEEQVNKE